VHERSIVNRNCNYFNCTVKCHICVRAIAKKQQISSKKSRKKRRPIAHKMCFGGQEQTKVRTVIIWV